MINYEIGGFLTVRRTDGKWKIADKSGRTIIGRGAEYANLGQEFRIPDVLINDIFIYTPPAKKYVTDLCKTCNGHKQIRDYDTEIKKTIEKRGGTLGCIYVKDCPECTKPKQEEIDFVTRKNTKDVMFKVSPDGKLEEISKIQEEKPQPKFNVGDKVRILSDAITYDDTVVRKYGVKSAIGKIGKVGNVEYVRFNNKVNVSELPSECYPDGGIDSWCYNFDQLEKLIPITEDNVKSLKAGDKLISMIDCSEYKLLEPYPSLAIESELYKYFMLVEPKEKPVLLPNEALKSALSELGFKAATYIICNLPRFCFITGSPLPPLKTFVRMNKGDISCWYHDNEYYFVDDITKSNKFSDHYQFSGPDGASNLIKHYETFKNKYKPKKTKEQIRDIVIEELKAKGFELQKSDNWIVYKKGNLQAVFGNFMQIESTVDPKKGFGFDYNGTKSINKFLAKVDEMLEIELRNKRMWGGVLQTSDIISSINRNEQLKKLKQKETAQLQEALNKANKKGWSKDYKLQVDHLVKEIERDKLRDKKEPKQFTKGQKIRCVGGEGIQYVPDLRPDNIYIFSNYQKKSLKLKDYEAYIGLKDYEGYWFYPDFFEPVEYVNFSKALELYKVGYTIQCEGFINEMNLYNQSEMICWEALLSDKWYWVKKPEGK